MTRLWEKEIDRLFDLLYKLSFQGSGGIEYGVDEAYGHAETCHAAILHHWMDMVEIKEA